MLDNNKILNKNIAKHYKSVIFVQPKKLKQTMSITAKAGASFTKELIPSGNYIARCYKMIQIGTVPEEFKEEIKMLEKVRIGWELPLELKVFNPEKGEQPLVIESEYTLSMSEKANLRKLLTSWRGKSFTEEEAANFDITKLIGAPCMLNIIHTSSKTDASKVYANVSGVTAIPKGFTVPEQINSTFILSYDNFDVAKFESLPEFIRNKMITSSEYQSLKSVAPITAMDSLINNQVIPNGDLPF